jgi:cation diffusion facilitator family transporter
MGRRVSGISLAINGGLSVVKLVTGVVGNSYALIADAIESLGDVLSSVIVWSGFVIASKPPDENHPYGHGKAEPLAALAVSGMLVGAAGLIAYQAAQGIRQPHDLPAPYTLIVLLVVVVIKEVMYRYEWAVAKSIESTAIAADAWHHRSDAITSLAAGVGITIALFGGKGYEAADDWAALAGCTIILINGLRFARLSVKELMDTVPETALADAIEEIALRVDGAKLVEKVLIRKMGSAVYVDLHLEVDPTIPVLEAHDIAHRVKDAISAGQPAVADVLVHIEPHIEPITRGKSISR